MLTYFGKIKKKKGMMWLIRLKHDPRPLKNGFTAAQKSFPLRGRPDAIMIHDKPLT
jgi:hypothetical protein